jgi:hypothetical protein
MGAIPAFADGQCTPEHRDKIREMTRQSESHLPHHCTVGHHLKSGLITQETVYEPITTQMKKGISSIAESRLISSFAKNKDAKEKV